MPGSCEDPKAADPSQENRQVCRAESLCALEGTGRRSRPSPGRVLGSIARI